MCHAEAPSCPGIGIAPHGLLLDTPQSIAQQTAVPAKRTEGREAGAKQQRGRRMVVLSRPNAPGPSSQRPALGVLETVVRDAILVAVVSVRQELA